MVRAATLTDPSVRKTKKDGAAPEYSDYQRPAIFRAFFADYQLNYQTNKIEALGYVFPIRRVERF
jgi:hypothetical protein